MLRSCWNRSFHAASTGMKTEMPEIQKDDLVEGGAGVRAQACDKNGGLVDDFVIAEKERVINVCNAPSPAATSSLAIGETIAQLASKRF